MSKEIRLVKEDDGASATLEAFIQDGKVTCPRCKHEFACNEEGGHRCGNCECYFFADDLFKGWESRKNVYAIE